MPRNDLKPLDLLEKILGGCLDRSLQPKELFQVRDAINYHLVPVADHNNKILMLGSYSSDQKARVKLVKEVLRELYRIDGNQSSYPFLLEDIPGTEIWINTEIKFRFFANVADYIVGVPESDTGGFIYEQGILSSNKELQRKTSLLKRDYPTQKEEHDNFSLMQADGTLFNILEQRGDLYRWEKRSDLIECCGKLYKQTLS